MAVKKIVGLTLAAAAAAAFTLAPMTSAFAEDAAAAGNVKCFGGNACKGQSACKTAKNSCKGANSCKGQGMSMAASDKACTDMGGKTSE